MEFLDTNIILRYLTKDDPTKAQRCYELFQQIKRKEIQRLMDNGLFPYTKRYLGTLRNHFSTIGVNGVNEMIRNFTRDQHDITSDYGHQFAVRLLDHMRTAPALFAGLGILVLDEADRMLDMGFMPDVRKIIEETAKETQDYVYTMAKKFDDELADKMKAAGIPVWCGGMLETEVGRAANLGLASLPGFSLPGDISASDRYYHEDITQERFVLNSDSTINVPSRSGLGVTIDPKALEKFTLKRETLR